MPKNDNEQVVEHNFASRSNAMSFDNNADVMIASLNCIPEKFKNNDKIVACISEENEKPVDDHNDMIKSPKYQSENNRKKTKFDLEVSEDSENNKYDTLKKYKNKRTSVDNFNSEIEITDINYKKPKTAVTDRKTRLSIKYDTVRNSFSPINNNPAQRMAHKHNRVVDQNRAGVAFLDKFKPNLLKKSTLNKSKMYIIITI